MTLRLLAVLFAGLLSAISLCPARAEGGAPSGDEAVAESDDTLDFEDLGEADDLDPEVEKRLNAHLQEARRLIDAGDLKGARAELDAADALVPMHEKVLELMEIVGALEDESEKSEALLQQIEQERREEAERARAARQTVRRVIERRRLPHRIPRAIRTLAAKKRDAEAALARAERAYDRCLGAAALAAAGGAAAACKDARARVRSQRKEVDALTADLHVLTEAWRKKKGDRAVERLLKPPR